MTALAVAEPIAGELGPHVPWSVWLPAFVASWSQGEHLSIIGHTGSGKSVFARELLEARTAASARWATAILANKPRDKELTSMLSRGWRRIRSWPPKHGERRVLLWPSMKGPEGFNTQAEIFDHALRELFEAGRWCIYADEIRYLTRSLGLGKLAELFWLQGRSMGITFVAGTQRSAFVPLEFYSQARHLILFQEQSPANRRRLVDHCGGANGVEVSRIVARLGPFEFLHVDTVTGALERSRVELKGR